jgi:hypothetical protein
VAGRSSASRIGAAARMRLGDGHLGAGGKACVGGGELGAGEPAAGTVAMGQTLSHSGMAVSCK